MTALIPIGIFAALGAVSGIALTVASKVFEVKEDKRIAEIGDTLPQANCGGCGYSGCADYAAAVVEKGAACNLCRPGGDAAAAKIAQIGRFLEEPSFYTDKFDVRGADGTISVRNLMQEDVTGKVVVFYKTVKDGKYFGGITYQATLKGGVPAGATVLVNANHFRINDSRLMFVRYE